VNRKKIYSFDFCGFQFYYHNRIGWMRIFGKGISWKDVNLHPLIFGERLGYIKGFYIGNNWFFKLLK
jgi:hypothetical protein